jgi:hypothetical protein
VHEVQDIVENLDPNPYGVEPVNVSYQDTGECIFPTFTASVYKLFWAFYTIFIYQKNYSISTLLYKQGCQWSWENIFPHVREKSGNFVMCFKAKVFGKQRCCNALSYARESAYMFMVNDNVSVKSLGIFAQLKSGNPDKT